MLDAVLSSLPYHKPSLPEMQGAQCGFNHRPFGFHFGAIEVL